MVSGSTVIPMDAGRTGDHPAETRVLQLTPAARATRRTTRMKTFVEHSHRAIRSDRQVIRNIQHGDPDAIGVMVRPASIDWTPNTTRHHAPDGATRVARYQDTQESTARH